MLPITVEYKGEEYFIQGAELTSIRLGRVIELSDLKEDELDWLCDQLYARQDECLDIIENIEQYQRDIADKQEVQTNGGGEWAINGK
jgi:phage tail protein X